MIYLSTIVFTVIFLLIISIFRSIPPNRKLLLHLTSFPVIFLGYLFADMLAYELTHDYFAFSHSLGTGILLLLGNIMVQNVFETWMLALYLLMFTIIESYFFYSGYKLGEILVPEVMEEIVSGKTKKERYYLGILFVIPLKVVMYVSIGSIWAAMHFPTAIIIHLFLALIFSIPISIYVIVKTRSMFSLILAWFLYDCFLILWL